MDKSFFKHLKGKDIIKVAVILFFGLLLIFLGGKDGESTEQQQGDDQKIADACSKIDGVGKCSVYVCYSTGREGDGDEVQSVIVICEGADSPDVRLCLTEMLSSFFGIGTNRIRVEKMQE